MVSMLTDRERTAADGVVGDADQFLEECRKALTKGTRGEAFIMLIIARFLELHPLSYRGPRDIYLTDKRETL